MKKYKWLFFDLDETIFDFSQSARLALQEVFMELNLESSDELIQHYEKINSEVWKLLREGRITSQKLKSKRWEDFLKPFNLKVSPEEVNDFYLTCIAKYTVLIPEASIVLDKFSQSYQLAAVTNGLAHVQRNRLKIARLENLFDAIVISEEIGAAKPQQEYFDAAFAICGKPSKSEVLMIGDNLLSDIKGGLDYGIDTCWYNPQNELNANELKPTFSIKNLTELFGIVF